MLLECEKRSELVVEEARHNYVKAMDKAYDDAKREIAELKKRREEQHQKFIIRIQKEQLDYETICENQNRAKLREINKRVTKNRSKVIDDIMRTVLKIQPVFHRNVFLDLQKEQQVKSIQQISEKRSHNSLIKDKQKNKILPKIQKYNSARDPSTSDSSSSSSSENTSSTSELSVRKKHQSLKSHHEEYRRKKNNFPNKK